MRNWGLETRLIHEGCARSQWGETSEALHLTSGFVYERAEHAEDRFADAAPGFMYSRYGNPTVATFEARMAALEGSETAMAMASGMAALNAALMCQLRAGMRVVAAELLFGSCRYIIGEILPRFGIETEFVDGGDLEAWEKALSRPADLVFFETPGNPTLQLVDVEAVCALAKAAGAKVIVDNVFATPVLQKPLELGADIVMYSATKHIDGHGRCLGGVICCDRAFRDEMLHPYCKHTGPTLSAFNAWVLAKGLESLSLRVERMQANAAAVARFLEERVGVRPLYPGLDAFPQRALAARQMKGGGTLVGFYAGGDKQRAFDVLNAFQLIEISNNLGDAKTLATHPATTTHSKLTAEERARLEIADDYIRLSVGLEDVNDVIADLDHALG